MKYVDSTNKVGEKVTKCVGSSDEDLDRYMTDHTRPDMTKVITWVELLDMEKKDDQSKSDQPKTPD